MRHHRRPHLGAGLRLLLTAAAPPGQFRPGQFFALPVDGPVPLGVHRRHRGVARLCLLAGLPARRQARRPLDPAAHAPHRSPQCRPGGRHTPSFLTALWGYMSCSICCSPKRTRKQPRTRKPPAAVERPSKRPAVAGRTKRLGPARWAPDRPPPQVPSTAWSAAGSWNTAARPRP